MAARKADVAEASPAIEAEAAEVMVADLEDAPVAVDSVSAAPPRNHESLISQLALKWDEVKTFAVHLTGNLDGELGDVLALVRKYEA